MIYKKITSVSVQMLYSTTKIVKDPVQQACINYMRE